ncbi:MAG: AAA-like domain-containing protein [Phaeodactylibacter sp.]|nr:AAA-like domain-containing protein [Phaeodactylibacter sp.]MCB9294485.1 AAA-like domain-containing protein [Lewinellaceae bacterium]
MQKRKRYFNTSGPNIPSEHYTLLRKNLIEKGMDLVSGNRYFTIWAPRQTGKSTYFRLLAEELRKKGYIVCHVNVENFLSADEKGLLQSISYDIGLALDQPIKVKKFSEFHDAIRQIQDVNFVFIVDEVEGINPAIFGQFLHTIRNLYHSREKHCLKSAILVGVSNIVGVAQDNASPFNIADNLEVPYFTKEETLELLGQHEAETGQMFEKSVKEKISQITANQPGLVNGFAYKLVEECKEKPVIGYEDYLEVEDWYLRLAIDKNVANILNKARQYRSFVERLLFRDEEVEFDIDREAIKVLHTNGIIRDDGKGYVEFWVPLYKKRIYKAFYPYTNGEKGFFFNQVADFFDLVKDGKIDFDFLIANYKNYVKRRSFKAFREKDEATGQYKSIKEAALKYSFETYISLFLERIEAKSYLEADTGLGRSDIIVNFRAREYVIETKIYRDSYQAGKGLKQLAYYCQSINIPEGLYLLFASNQLQVMGIEEGVQEVEDVKIRIYIVWYDEEKDF